MMTKYIVMRCNDQMHYYWLYVYAARIKKKDMGRTMWEYCKCWMMDKEVKHFLVNFVSNISFTLGGFFFFCISGGGVIHCYIPFTVMGRLLVPVTAAYGVRQGTSLALGILGKNH